MFANESSSGVGAQPSSTAVSPPSSQGGSVSLQYPLLTKSNYSAWAMKMEVYMEAQGVWDAIESEGPVEIRRDKMALAAIFQGINEETLLQLGPKKSAKEAWSALKTMHLGAARVKEVRAQGLRWELEGMRMGDNDSVDDFTARIIVTVNRLRSLGEDVEESYVVKKILRAVSPKFLQIASTIEEFGDLSTKTTEEVIGSLKAHEERLRGHEMRNEEHVLLARDDWRSQNSGKFTGLSMPREFGRNRGRGRWRGSSSRGSGRNYGSGGRNSTGNFGRQRPDLSRVRCYSCNNHGHFASECKEKIKNEEEEIHLAEYKCEEPALLMVEELKDSEPENKFVSIGEEKALSAEIQQPEEATETMWYFDTGASNHMTGNKEILTDLDETETGKVRFGDGSLVKIHGRGTVLFQCKTGEHLIMRDVYYIPKMRSNIISLGQLEENGAKTVITGGYLQVFDPYGRLVARIQRAQNRLYVLKMTQAVPVCLLARIKEKQWLWHARFGHLHFQALRKLARDEMVKGLPILEQANQVCDCCHSNKQHRVSFPRASEFRAKTPLELLHGDICGPLSPTSLGGNRFFLLIVDDCTRYAWVEMLRSKDTAFEAFRRIKRIAETEFEGKVKALRTDRGGEFTSREFNQYCEEFGIRRQLTAPYSPQQNGVVERRNQTVMEMTRCLLKGGDMPARFWAEAVRTAIHILNRSSTRSLEGMTPYQALFGRIPNVHHFRTFGCTAFVKNVKPHLKKLEERSSKMIFLGYETGSKAYRFIDPETNKIKVSRDVVFMEDEHWNWDKHQGSIGETNERRLTVELRQADSGSVVAASLVSPEPASSPISAPVSAAQSSTQGDSLVQQQLVEPESPIAENVQTSPTESLSSPEETEKFRSLKEIYENSFAEECEIAMCLMSVEEPTEYEEAASNDSWRQAMIEEIVSIEKNGTWELTQLPQGHKPIGLKWVYKIKKNPEGEIVKHKARVVAKGYVQRFGVDYEEVFAPVARLETVRLLLSMAAQESWEVHHMDVKSAFLNGDLEEEVYVLQPAGFVKKGQEDKVLRLRKALYGLKQAPRAWNTKLDACLRNLGFEKCTLEHAVYRRFNNGEVQIVGVYVDDLIVMGSNKEELFDFKEQMKKQFEMSDLGLLSYYLGIEVKQEANSITLVQSTYAQKLLEKLGMAECKPSSIPMDSRLKLSKTDTSSLVDSTMYRSAIGSLRYLLNTRPDLTFSVGMVSRYMESPTTNHLAAVKQILRYVKGTIGYGCRYYKNQEEKLKLIGYSDSDLAGDVDDRKSTTGVVYFLGSSPITWLSQKQRTVALSSCEAEYVAATAGVCQGVWLQRLVEELLGIKIETARLKMDNKSAIAISKNPVHHSRSKHIDIKFHFVRDCVQNGSIEIDFVRTEDELADILTKPLARSKFEVLRTRIGVSCLKIHQV